MVIESLKRCYEGKPTPGSFMVNEVKKALKDTVKSWGV
jgi:hypothetical protein